MKYFIKRIQILNYFKTKIKIKNPIVLKKEIHFF